LKKKLEYARAQSVDFLKLWLQPAKHIECLGFGQDHVIGKRLRQERRGEEIAMAVDHKRVE